MTIRKAELNDIQALFEMINHYVAEGIMLRRTLTELYECVREFQVAVAKEDGAILGAAALKIYSPELGEIRSLCVAPGLSGRGVGRALTESLLAEAERYQLKTVFALTTSPGFFERLGFHEMARERFPMKIWRDCLRCDRYFHCNEKTVAIDLARRQQTKTDEKAEAVGVTD